MRSISSDGAEAHIGPFSSADQIWRPQPTPDHRPVWVLLDELYRHAPTHTRTVTHGLHLTGRAKGQLTGWRRSHAGDWLGLVSFQIDYADGAPRHLELHDQLVPAYALQPRTT